MVLLLSRAPVPACCLSHPPESTSSTLYRCIFSREEATNNTAEYEGLLAGLRIAIDLGIRRLIIRGDSQLVVRQINKNYQCPLMEAYVGQVRKLEQHFDGLQMEHVPRAQNNIADDLSKRAAKRIPVEPGTFVQHLTQPSVTPSTRPGKRRKANTDNYFLAELTSTHPGSMMPATSKILAGKQLTPAGPEALAVEPQAPAGLSVPAIEKCAPAEVEEPLVLVVEPQAPTWARQLV